MDGVLCPVQRHAEQHSFNPRLTRWESITHAQIISLRAKTLEKWEKALRIAYNVIGSACGTSRTC
jgi:hypothetical protein